MLICGVKASHDGAVAVVEQNDNGVFLIGSVEAEKIENGDRYSDMNDPALILEGLRLCGVKLENIDRMVVDGWHGALPTPWIWPTVKVGGIAYPVAPYTQTDGGTPAFTGYKGLLRIDGYDLPYESYRHVEGHAASAYGTSSAAYEGRPAAVLVWDGGMFPQVYTIHEDTVEYHGSLFTVRSRVYETFGMLFAPFNISKSASYAMSVSGKIMAYAGLGVADPTLVAAMRSAWDSLDVENPAESLRAAVDRHIGDDTGSILASFQQAIGEELVAGLERFRSVLPDDLCIAGGAGLNIKWNSMIRNSGLFTDVWVPPFPNDSGSAIGAAYASVLARGSREPLQWSVYAGPDLRAPTKVIGWQRKQCSIDELAILLELGKPVVVLSGRAEVGPRALGHRSIMASPVSAKMKEILNDMKGRESYRPVAPMCLEEHAADVFDPGCPDPYMLFDHKVREDWVDKIPAVLHLDGTARLQTVTEESLPYRIVNAFYKRTGIPVLCNTSANMSGKGFFPDVASALRWGKTDHVWSDGFLYTSINSEAMGE